jgi:hypothetical protein
VRSTQILELLAEDASAYVLDEVGSGEIVVKNADGIDMLVTDDYGRLTLARVPYAVFEPLIHHGYVTQGPSSGRIYQISPHGLRAIRSRN